jgi:hypothetical protein
MAGERVEMKLKTDYYRRLLQAYSMIAAPA